MKPENVKCPSCGGAMTPRTNIREGTKFWGCINFPICKGTRDSMGLSKQDKYDIKNEDDNDDGYADTRWDRK